MPATKYLLSISADFGGSFSSEGWVSEIEGSSISVAIDHSVGGITTHGDSVETWFADVLSSADEQTLNGLPASHYSFWREPIMQQVVSKREQRLSSVIFTEYPAGSGKMFGCSVADQDNWNKLATLDSRGLVIYPFRAYTYDHMDFHDIVDSADLTAAIAAVSLAVMTERASADAVLNEVASAADEASAQAAAEPYLSS